jgi:hypothetical protein
MYKSTQALSNYSHLIKINQSKNDSVLNHNNLKNYNSIDELYNRDDSPPLLNLDEHDDDYQTTSNDDRKCVNFITKWYKTFIIVSVTICLVLLMIYTRLSTKTIYNHNPFPRKIILIQHGEESLNSTNHLSLKGILRAELLPLYFINPVNNLVEVPDYIYAKNAHEHEDEHENGILHEGSLRSIESVEPLAKYFNIPLNKNFHLNETKLLINDILSLPDISNKVVLICWQHDHLVKIVKKLGLNFVHGWNFNIKHESHKFFNMMWIIEYNTPVSASLTILKTYDISKNKTLSNSKEEAIYKREFRPIFE